MIDFFSPDVPERALPVAVDVVPRDRRYTEARQHNYHVETLE